MTIAGLDIAVVTMLSCSVPARATGVFVQSGAAIALSRQGMKNYRLTRCAVDSDQPTLSKTTRSAVEKWGMSQVVRGVAKLMW
jgi:hypothetical protein